MSKEKFYITTPIYYVNDVPHIGHTYTTVAADVLARYNRLKLGADNVYFLTGTDEHGVKIAQAAEEKGKTPQIFVDELAAKFQTAWDSFDISQNDFIRTTEERHEKVVKELYLILKEVKTPDGNDFLYKADYQGLYCVGCESFKTEDDLVDGKCPDHQTEPVEHKETNWFFRISDYENDLKRKINSGELVIQPESKQKEVMGLLDQGLKDVAVSRQNLKWGIELPFDQEQVSYVWIEALMNYISALGGPEGDLFKKFWPANVHLMAKDILKFHAVIWPIMLIALGLELPEKVYAHGYFTIDSQKMSKTIGNVIAPAELAEKYGVDAAKFLLLNQFHFGNDGDISLAKLDEMYNNVLGNDLGNLVSRVLSMTEKYFEGSVPDFDPELSKLQKFDLQADWSRYDYFLDMLQFDDAIEVVWENIRKANAYIEDQKPWELATSNQEVLAEVIYNLLEIIRQTAIFLIPFMPNIADQILTQLGYDPAKEKQKSFEELQKWGSLSSGQQIKKGDVLFPRLVDNS